MDEKSMVNDILNNTRLELTMLQNMINDTENLGLRQIIIQIRNNCESFQYELFKTAKLKEYYSTVEPATAQEIENVKNKLQN